MLPLAFYDLTNPLHVLLINEDFFQMRDIFSFFSDQTPQPGAQEGLPYWIFWFLLSIIVLLVIFIFLRDKTLRQRLNQFLFRTKQKLVRLRLQKNLAGEKKKKIGYLHELGQTARAKKIRLPEDEKLIKKITSLEKSMISRKKETKTINSKIETLKADFEKDCLELDTEKDKYEEDKKPQDMENNRISGEVAKAESLVHTLQKDLKKFEKNLRSSEKSLQELARSEKAGVEEKVVKEKGLNSIIQELEERKKETQKSLPEIQQKMEDLSEQQRKIAKTVQESNDKIQDTVERKKQKSKIFHSEVKEGEKDKENNLDLIRDLEKQMSPLFLELGELFERSRVDNKDLSLLYSQIDRANKRTSDLEKQIKDLV